MTREAIEAAVRANYESQREAMVTGDVHRLGGLLGDGFTLTHMTGYVQPRQEWLDEIATGSMRYHAMADVALTVSGNDSNPTVTVRTLTDATIWGMRHEWRLRLRIDFAQDGHGRWLATRTVASTW